MRKRSQRSHTFPISNIVYYSNSLLLPFPQNVTACHKRWALKAFNFLLFIKRLEWTSSNNLWVCFVAEKIHSSCNNWKNVIQFWSPPLFRIKWYMFNAHFWNQIKPFRIDCDDSEFYGRKVKCVQSNSNIYIEFFLPSQSCRWTVFFQRKLSKFLFADV